MEITPGRAMYSPDEELKPLRQPKTHHPESAAGNSTLSINAAEFVPSCNRVTAVQERLQKHQRQYLEQNYQKYQQLQQTEQYQDQHQQTYSNGYDNQQQQQQQQQQQYQQQSKVHNILMATTGSSSIQDRLLTGNNSASRDNEGGCYFYQQRGNGGGAQHDYQQNNHYRYNKNHNNHQQHQLHQHQHQHHHHHQHQNRYNNEQNSQQHQQHQQQQQFHQQIQQQSSTASALAVGSNDMENIALDYLQSVIQCLNQNPGQFDSIATRFNYIFEGMESNHFVLSNAMEDIFNESIRNPNFRYMGAKLYSLLHTLNSSKDSLFHTLLQYKLDFHQQQVREYIQKKQEAKVRETALFLAELYMQLRGEDSRNSLIAENIVFSLKELLSMEANKDNLRCICLTLKLAGYDLSTDCPNDMRDIITKLDTINFQNPGKYPLANNVIALQKNNWGRKTNGSVIPAETHTSQQIQETLRASDDPVFYGPDGHEITPEECEFLTNGAAYTLTSSDNEEDNDDVDLDPEMDEETERDYKLFLKQANNKS